MKDNDALAKARRHAERILAENADEIFSGESSVSLVERTLAASIRLNEVVKPIAMALAKQHGLELDTIQFVFRKESLPTSPVDKQISDPKLN